MLILVVLMLFRSLFHFWRMNLAVLLAVSVATAVLTGAFLVGDSVRGSLRHLTLDRLGPVDYTLTATGFFRQSLADEIVESEATRTDLPLESMPIISLTGTAVQPQTKARRSKVNIYGLPTEFGHFWQTSSAFPLDLDQREASADHLPKTGNPLFPSVMLNRTLQQELQVEVGDTIVLSFERPTNIHREFILGRREYEDLVQSLRLTVTQVIADQGIGRFGLQASQHFPANAYLDLEFLQQVVDREKQVNTVLLSVPGPDSADLVARLKQRLRFSDLGLVFRHNNGQSSRNEHLIVESRDFLLPPDLASALQSAANALDLQWQPIFTYLANRITANGQHIPYSTITAMDLDAHAIASHTDQANLPPPILLNRWAFNSLGLTQTNQPDVTIQFFVPDAEENLQTKTARFRLVDVIEMDTIDQQLTPKLPGVQTAGNMSDWDVPFPIDYSQIRSVDEQYWDLYRTTPKAVISLQAGQELWANRFGDLTALRISGLDRSISQIQEGIEQAVLDRLTPQQLGFQIQNVRSAGLSASKGSTDFSGLFIGLSLFLIISAILMIGLLFRLGVEIRLSEVGLLRATGFSVKQVQIRLSLEGLILSVVGTLLGLIIAVGYASLMIYGLRTWWIDAVGTTALTLHVLPTSLFLGLAISLIMAPLTIGWTVWRLHQTAIISLLRRQLQTEPISRSNRNNPQFLTSTIAAICLAFAVLTTLYASLTRLSPTLFYLAGTLLLLSGLLFFSVWLHNRPRQRFNSQIKTGIRNTKRRPGRSLLCVALVACASFVIVAVGANRHTTPNLGGRSHQYNRQAGTGGFTYIAETDIPILNDIEQLNSAVGMNQAVFPCRLLPGDDASCLNLFQPRQPRLLGFSDDLIQRGGFQFQQTVAQQFDNPWQLLKQDLGDGVVPVFGDYNSVMWILHLGLSQDLEIQNELGQTIKLRIAGLLKGSIFQSELIMSADNLSRHFPGQAGYRWFLIRSSQPDIATQLEEQFRDYGLDVVSTVQKLRDFHLVEHTYMSVFQAIGGLGLMLGTLGLGIVLVRNTIERKQELAMLRAFGFRQLTLSVMLLIENSFLILVGLGIGTVSALLAVAPHLLSMGNPIPLFSLVITLVLVLAVGVGSNLIVIRATINLPLLSTLKSEL